MCVINFTTLFSKIIDGVFNSIQKEISRINIIRNSSDYIPISNDIIRKTCCYYIRGNQYSKITCTCTTRCQECDKIIGRNYKKDLTVMYNTIGANNYRYYPNI